MLTEEDRPVHRPPGYVYKPNELRIADLHLNDIHIREKEGRTQVFVMAMYGHQRDVVIWEDSPHLKVGKWWCFLADAVCRWLNKPAEERDAERGVPKKRFSTAVDLLNAGQ